jgi:hypothetical protein
MIVLAAINQTVSAGPSRSVNGPKRTSLVTINAAEQLAGSGRWLRFAASKANKRPLREQPGHFPFDSNVRCNRGADAAEQKLARYYRLFFLEFPNSPYTSQVEVVGKGGNTHVTPVR